jgi:hypothetical protein
MVSLSSSDLSSGRMRATTRIDMIRVDETGPNEGNGEEQSVTKSFHECARYRVEGLSLTGQHAILWDKPWLYSYVNCHLTLCLKSTILESMNMLPVSLKGKDLFDERKRQRRKALFLVSLAPRSIMSISFIRGCIINLQIHIPGTLRRLIATTHPRSYISSSTPTRPGYISRTQKVLPAISIAPEKICR